MVSGKNATCTYLAHFFDVSFIRMFLGIKKYQIILNHNLGTQRDCRKTLWRENARKKSPTAGLILGKNCQCFTENGRKRTAFVDFLPLPAKWFLKNRFFDSFNGELY